MIDLNPLAFWIGAVTLYLLLFGFLIGAIIFVIWTFVNPVFNMSITLKAVTYAICSEYWERKKQEHYDGSMKIGQKWWTRYKDKRYEWTCTKEEEVGAK